VLGVPATKTGVGLNADQILSVLPKIEDHWFNDVLIQRFNGLSLSIGYGTTLDYATHDLNRPKKFSYNNTLFSAKYFRTITKKSQINLTLEFDLFKNDYTKQSDFFGNHIFPVFDI